MSVQFSYVALYAPLSYYADAFTVGTTKKPSLVFGS